MIRGAAVILLAMVAFCSVAQRKKGGLSPSPEKQLTLFSVNNRSVSAGEFIYLYQKNHMNPSEGYTREKVQEYLDLFVNFKLKVEEARSRGLDTTQSFRKEYNSYKDELRKPYLPEGKLVDSLVKLTYERMKEEVRVAHILVNLKPDASPKDTLAAFAKADELYKRAQAGEDFGSLAASYSDDPSSRINQGDLGYFTALQMVYPFETAAYTGKPGSIVGPVRTRFGYHILKIENRKPARGEVEVAHIMLRNGTGRDDQKSRNLIFEIYDQLKGGAAWDELCVQYSEDQNSKNNGCKLKPFGVRAMATVPEFDQVAFALQQPGEISDPFQTTYGWHIVKLEKKIPLPSFNEISGSLKSRVMRDERVQLSRQALMEKLKKEFEFTEHEEVKSKIFIQADSSLTKGKWKLTTWPVEETLFTISGRRVTGKEFVEYVQKNQRTNAHPPASYIVQLYNAFVESIINQAFEERLIRSNPDFEMLLKEYYEGILLFDIMEKEVWNKAGEDSVGQRTYFEEHATSYQAGERALAEIYSSTNAEGIKELREALTKNDTIAIQQIIQEKKIRQEKGRFQQSDRPLFQQVDWNPGLYQTENKGMYYLARILEILPPGQMAFDEARASIITDYQNYLEQNWLVTLRKKYPVQINEKGKKYVFQKLAN